MGIIQKRGVKNLLLTIPRDNATLNHESLHGLSLAHTHRDGTPIDDAVSKYIYPQYSASSGHTTDTTDNIMSYLPTGKTTWFWQWEIMKKNV
jgi:hypothetical protein